jgi:hypothetical protein
MDGWLDDGLLGWVDKWTVGWLDDSWNRLNEGWLFGWLNFWLAGEQNIGLTIRWK